MVFLNIVRMQTSTDGKALVSPRTHCHAVTDRLYKGTVYQVRQERCKKYKFLVKIPGNDSSPGPETRGACLTFSFLLPGFPTDARHSGSHLGQEFISDTVDVGDVFGILRGVAQF